MGTGWRRAFCTTIPREPENTVLDKQQQQSPCPSPSPRNCAKLSFFSTGSNPSTPRFQSQPVSSPRLRCRTTFEPSSTSESPTLHCKSTPRAATKSPKPILSSNPSSPLSPLKLSLFRNSFKFRSSCGICLNSVKTGQGTAIYTAECAHAFHFPCIAAHVRKHDSLICPVCNTTWKDVPLLSIHRNSTPQNDTVLIENTTPRIEDKKIMESCSPRIVHQPEPKPKPKVRTSDLRSYDDDEPLLSPTTGARFIPIPEADENIEQEEYDDVEEFQGFFVNPNSSPTVKSDDVLPFNGRDLRNVQARLSPEAAVISVGHGYETCAVALKIKAPPPPAKMLASSRNCSSSTSLLEPSHRAPIDLVTVLDASGGMIGAKLQMLKLAMRLVISSLGSGDRLSIVAFSATPKRLLPLRRMTAQGQKAARRIIDRLACGQGTSLGDALRKATKVLEDRRERNPVASIMLLSDGQDERVKSNASSQRHHSSHAPSTRFAHIEIPVHAFGFGQSGGYNSHEPAEDAFAKCVGGLLSVVVQDLRIQLSCASGSAPAEITAVYSCSGKPTVITSSSLFLGDLYAEEERELLVELKVPTSAVGSNHVMCVRCLYKDPATQEVVYGRDQALLVPGPNDVRLLAPKIELLRFFFITTRAVAEARRLIECSNDLRSAYHLLGSARALLIQSNSLSADEYVRSLDAELAELHWRKQKMMEIQRRRVNERERERERETVAVVMDENGEPVTLSSAWRAAEKLAKVAVMKKSLTRVGDLHGFENARF
ncbi:auxin-responsive protein IAA9-like isoform X1 [Hibiscus syriacus]|uniref:Auxin-responsive protein IAA9-like isoform X1 n=1 Tax=Hibiscus syriacus TaxID=106335 RepID=A0A6A2XSI3_HIBSY|nr:E3 ubiquitin-protein ligase WAV3-like [Hibiscus syriacus]KAE8659217.1 auxin-responsive protein IAA9-like isoform X1 [Hibiscus syriacus]